MTFLLGVYEAKGRGETLANSKFKDEIVIDGNSDQQSECKLCNHVGIAIETALWEHHGSRI